MSIFLKDQWKEWAREWGLTHHPEKGWLYRTEHVVGDRKGLLIRVGWGRDESPGLTVCVRFPRVADPEQLRRALIDDPALDALPGKGSSRRKMFLESGSKKVIRLAEIPEFVLSDNCFVWRRVFAFRNPKPAEVQSWVDTLVQAVTRAARPFDGRCESCPTGMARRYVLVDGLPMMLCAACQQRLKAEGEMADRTYEMTEVRHVPGAVLACVAVVVGAVVWAALGALTERTFAAVAIGIGALVAWSYRQGAGRVDLTGRLIAGCLTIASVVVGEILLYTWWFAKARPDVGFNLDAGWFVYMKTWAERPGQEIINLLFGLVGAWVATQALQRPKLRANIESGDSDQEQRRAA